MRALRFRRYSLRQTWRRQEDGRECGGRGKGGWLRSAWLVRGVRAEIPGPRLGELALFDNDLKHPSSQSWTTQVSTQLSSGNISSCCWFVAACLDRCADTLFALVLSPPPFGCLRRPLSPSQPRSDCRSRSPVGRRGKGEARRHSRTGGRLLCQVCGRQQRRPHHRRRKGRGQEEVRLPPPPIR